MNNGLIALSIILILILIFFTTRHGYRAACIGLVAGALYATYQGQFPAALDRDRINADNWDPNIIVGGGNPGDDDPRIPTIAHVDATANLDLVEALLKVPGEPDIIVISGAKSRNIADITAWQRRISGIYRPAYRMQEPPVGSTEKKNKLYAGTIFLIRESEHLIWMDKPKLLEDFRREFRGTASIAVYDGTVDQRYLVTAPGMAKELPTEAAAMEVINTSLNAHSTSSGHISVPQRPRRYKWLLAMPTIG